MFILLLNIHFMNWHVLILFSIAAVGLIVFLVMRNVKDEKQVIDQLNDDYPKPTDENNEATTDVAAL